MDEKYVVSIAIPKRTFKLLFPSRSDAAVYVACAIQNLMDETQDLRIAGKLPNPEATRMVLELKKKNLHFGRIRADPLEPGEEVMTLAEHLSHFIAVGITPDLIVKDVTAIIGDVLNAKYDLRTPISPAFKVGDLLKVKAFFKVDWIVNELIGTYIGRLVHKAATNHYLVDFENNPEMLEVLLPVLAETDGPQFAAIPLVIEQCVKKHGDPGVPDELEVARLRKLYQDEMVEKVQTGRY